MVNFPPSDYVSGEITLTENDAEFTGTGTGWLAMMFRSGDLILDIEDAPEYVVVIDEITSNTSGTLTRPWPGPTVTCGYRMRYQWDAGRVTAMSAALREELGNGNIQALAGLTGMAGGVPVFTGPGAMELRAVTDFVTGVAYDIQVDTLADRAVYDDQAAGFSVLVSDVGDGRSAVYSKVSSDTGDWSDPAFVTGPQGAMPILEVGSTTTGDPGSDAEVDISPIAGGYELDFTIPAGEGFYAQGSYDSGTTYNTGDVVLYNGSSFTAKVETTGNAPPTLPTTENTWWQLIARAGIDGAGTVTTVSAGVGVAVDLADPTAPEVGLANVPSGTIKGRVAAGNGPPADLTVEEAAALLGVPAKADQTTAEAGTDNDDFMTALRVKQAIDALTTPFDPSSIYTNIALLALNDAGFEGTVLGFSGMIADAFEDQSGVSAAILEIIPGATGTALGDASARLAAAFDGNNNKTNGASATKTVSGANQSFNVGKDWGAGVTRRIGRFVLTPTTDVGYTNSAAVGGDNNNVIVKLQGSNDNWTSATDLYTSGIVNGGLMGPANALDVQSGINIATAYRYHRVLILEQSPAGSNHTMTLAQVVFYEQLATGDSINQVYDAVNGLYRPSDTGGTPNNMTLVSVGYPSQVQPDKARLVVQTDTPLAVTPGVDFSGEVSRDGINWVEAEDLARVASIGDIKTYASGAIDLSGEPAGVDMHWRLKTLTNKDIAFTGVVENWG